MTLRAFPPEGRTPPPTPAPLGSRRQAPPPTADYFPIDSWPPPPPDVPPDYGHTVPVTQPRHLLIVGLIIHNAIGT